MLKLTLLICAFCVHFIQFTNAANILVLDTLLSPSHHLWTKILVNGVAKNDQHNITVLSLKPDTKPHRPNIHYIDLENVYEYFYGTEAESEFNFTESLNSNLMYAFKDMHDLDATCLDACVGMFKSKGFQTILNYPTTFKFDVVLYNFYCGPCTLGVIDHFKHTPSIIGISASGLILETYAVIGGHQHHAYVPHFSLPFDSEMNFFQRLFNVLMNVYGMRDRANFILPKSTELIEKRLGRKLTKSLEEMESDTKVVLINSTPLIDIPEPLPPNLIPVGGLQIQASKPLPSELENFVNSSVKGTVYFSFGTVFKYEQVKKETRQIILSAMKELPDYNFVWKCEAAEIPKRPAPNVWVQEYFPQNDILAHPKLIGFVSHSGMLSSQEATWHGVPMLGIPFLLDQRSNIKKLVRAGAAETLSFLDLTKDLLMEKILQIVENPKYRENMKLRSADFRDQETMPLDRAVWWIERIIRNPNVEYMKSPYFRLGFIKSNAYDVLFVLMLGFLLTVTLTVFLIWKLIVCVWHRPKVNKQVLL